MGRRDRPRDAGGKSSGLDHQAAQSLGFCLLIASEYEYVFPYSWNSSFAPAHTHT